MQLLYGLLEESGLIDIVTGTFEAKEFQRNSNGGVHIRLLLAVIRVPSIQLTSIYKGNQYGQYN